MQGISDIHGLYHLDPAHSALGFYVRHAGLSRIRGTFGQFHGYALIDCSNVEHSALMVRISATSINTLVPDRDAHLRGADFLDVATYPALTFVATGFRILDNQHVLISGDLTIKDVTRPLEMVFAWTGSSTDPFGNERIGFQSELKISRADFGLTWNAALETGGWLIGDEVTLEIEASAVKKAADVEDDEQDTELMVVAETEGLRRGVDHDEVDDFIEQVQQRRARRALDVEDEDEDGPVVHPQPAVSEPQSTVPGPQPTVPEPVEGATDSPGAQEDQRGGLFRRFRRP